MTRSPTAAIAAATLTAAVVLAGCANTVNTEATVPDVSAAPATTFVAEGTPAELLAQLVTDSRALSETIVENEGDDELIARIDATWAAAKPAVEEAAPDLVSDLERALRLMHNGVERRRPADADKGSRNLEAVVDLIDV